MTKKDEFGNVTEKEKDRRKSRWKRLKFFC